MITGPVCFKQELMFVMQNLGPIGGRGKNSSSKMPYLESLSPIFLFTVQVLWGNDDD